MSATPSIFFLPWCNCVVANFFKLLPELFLIRAGGQHFWSQLIFSIQLQHKLSKEHSAALHLTCEQSANFFGSLQLSGNS